MINRDYKKIHEDIVQWIREWFEKNGKGCNAVIGMSGGKDSTIVAALCAEALGKDRVIGIGMPDTGQGLNEADEICKYLGITFLRVPIREITNAFKGLWYFVEDEDFKWSAQSEQNIPPRIRMTLLYAFAQTFNGRVPCTCNLSEDYVGYFTLWGDGVGDFAPLRYLTVTEIRALGDEMGLPQKWVHKIPDDGLPHSSSDEAKFGFSYEMLDKYIRWDNVSDMPEEIISKIKKMHDNSSFKLKLADIPGPEITKFCLQLV